jgi:hypothetical protein
MKYVRQHKRAMFLYFKEPGMHLERRQSASKPKSETNALATWKINAINIKQAAPMQISTQTRLNYGFQLWGTASNSDMEILQGFQSKTLRRILNAPWCI